MVKSILGRKVGMTQIFEEIAAKDAGGNEVLRRTGRVIPVTVIQAGPCVVTQKKTLERDGYEAVQIGYGDVRESRLTRPERGHLGLYRSPRRTGEGEHKRVRPVRHLRELRMAGVQDLNIGDEITVEVFREGDLVDVTGTSKGKGFQGVVKRYHWHGGDKTHGSMVHRKPQSAGATDPARIFKNTGRPGHMGHERVTVKRLRVVRIIPDRNVLLVRGAVPGPNGGLVSIREAK
ncbi:MAG: 50S ribosomal protein L3 [Armatimonadetes bacterium]|nr:50S ribosomal protein L3 [Armatimonadota bacterium]